jgi:HEAT repeat protein
MLSLPPLPRKIGAALTDARHARTDVRLSALRDLVRLTRAPSERGEALAGLERMLASDPAPELRAEAAVGLADAEANESRGALLAAIGDRDARVRQMAVLALGEVAEPGDAESVARVRPLLAAEEAPIRFQALIAFVHLAPEDAERVLAVAAADEDEEVRAMVYRLMDNRYQTEDAPDHLRKRAMSALDDHATAVRAVAALFLARNGERSADKVIVGVIDGSVPAATEADLCGAFEVAAAEGLEAARPGLRRRAFGPLGVRSDTVGWHALIALARLGDERAKNAILRGLSAWTRNARTLAVVAAGRAKVVEARARLEAFRDKPGNVDPDALAEALASLGKTSD